MKKYLRLAIILFLSALIFFGSSYFYLYRSFENEKKAADIKEEKIPYGETPDNRGLLFNIGGDTSVLFFLDFNEEISYIIKIDNYNSTARDYAGYPIDYKFDMDYYVLSSVFDRLGGLDLDIDGEVLRYTGIQICDILSAADVPDIPLKIITALCTRISENGFSSEDFIFLIENTGTSLTVPECMYWQRYMKSIFSNVIFVNWEI